MEVFTDKFRQIQIISVFDSNLFANYQFIVSNIQFPLPRRLKIKELP